MSIANIVERSNPEDMPEAEAAIHEERAASSKPRVHSNTWIVGIIVICSVVSFGLGWFLGQGSAGPVVGASATRSLK